MTTFSDYVEAASRAAADVTIALLGFASPLWFALFADDAHLFLIILGVALLVLRIVAAVFDVKLRVRRWRDPP